MTDEILATVPVLRFAPSPNGALHLGHAYSALMNERIAAETNGRVLLRIEDLDRTRCKPQFEAAIVDDLVWLGLRFPSPRRQSEHANDYAAALARQLPAEPHGPVLTIHFRKGDTSLRMFTTIATLGTAHDLTLQEIRIECFFPADQETAARMRDWA